MAILLQFIFRCVCLFQVLRWVSITLSQLYYEFAVENLQLEENLVLYVNVSFDNDFLNVSSVMWL